MLTTVLTGETVQHLVPVIALLGSMELTVAEVYSENTKLSITLSYIFHIIPYTLPVCLLENTVVGINMCSV